MNAIPDILTKHSVLTRISKNDLKVLREIFDDDETKRFLPELYELIDAPNGILKFVSTFELYTQNGEGYLWGIKPKNELVGFVAVMDLLDAPVLFYAMHPNHRSKGYLKDAICGVLDYLSGKIQMISTDIYKGNIISTALLKQLGFCVCKENDEKVYMFKKL